MASIQPLNFVQTALRAPVAPTDTQLQLTAGTGYLFNPIASGSYVYITVNDSTTAEVMKYTSSGSVINDTITVTRAQDNTTAKAFPAGACVAIQWDVAQVSDYITQQVLNLFGTVSLPINTILTNGTPVAAPPTNVIYAVDPNTGQMWFYNGGLGAWLYINSNSTQLLSTAPSVAPAGNIVWSIDTITATLYYWTGVTWLAIAGGGSANFLQVISRQYIDATGVGIAKGTDNGIGGSGGMVALGTITFPTQCAYKSNVSITDKIVVPSSGTYINDYQFPANSIVELTASFVGDRVLDSTDFHAALTIIHANDTFEWQSNIFVPANTGTTITGVGGMLCTDPFQVTGPDYFDLVLTVYDSGASYDGFILKKLSFAAKVIALP